MKRFICVILVVIMMSFCMAGFAEEKSIQVSSKVWFELCLNSEFAEVDKNAPENVNVFKLVENLGGFVFEENRVLFYDLKLDVLEECVPQPEEGEESSIPFSYIVYGTIFLDEYWGYIYDLKEQFFWCIFEDCDDVYSISFPAGLFMGMKFPEEKTCMSKEVFYSYYLLTLKKVFNNDTSN